ncbi:MAG: hypothetical protein KGI68_04130 [Alphaproteobacteria bacterium]|nr:hypothetical protein [Alphaproteobacteria bacterium]MDE2162937.1 hypothetical protein [Alphaproteobacteria bacterium]MDE2501027.1 hypothetical protein [Alphaproteobacteria bacterium]
MTGKEWILRIGLALALVVLAVAALAALMTGSQWFAPILLRWSGISPGIFFGIAGTMVALINTVVWWRVFRRKKLAKA